MASVETPWFDSLKPIMQTGHSISLLEGGRDYFSALEQAIGLARERIFIETYIFEDDASGRKVARALAQAADRGVTVNLTIDGFGTAKLKGDVASILTSSKVNLAVFRPDHGRWALNRQRLRRLHRKLSVFDGHTAFVGGINMLDDYFDPNHGVLESPRFDFAVKVQGPVVATIHLAMQRLWWELRILSRKDRLTIPDSVMSSIVEGGTYKAMFVPRDNFRFRRTIEQTYLKAIGSARRDVLIANAYFFPGVRFRRALIEAASRGVRVRLLLQGLMEYRLQHYASKAMYGQLLHAGVEIIEYKKSFLHAKVAVIDNWATVGSSNIDPFSLLLAREANLVIDNAQFSGQLREAIERGIRDGGEPVLEKNFERRTVLVRFVQWFAFIVLRLAVALTGASGKF